MFFKDKRGFTLVELMITLSLTTLVFICLITLVGMINATISRNESSSKVTVEIQETQNVINAWFKSFDSSSFEINNVFEHEIIINEIATSQHSTLNYIQNKLINNDLSVNLNFEYINNISFDYASEFKMIKCNFSYLEKTYSFLLNKRSIN